MESCMKTFRYPKDVRRHMLRVHGEDAVAKHECCNVVGRPLWSSPSPKAKHGDGELRSSTVRVSSRSGDVLDFRAIGKHDGHSAGNLRATSLRRFVVISVEGDVLRALPIKAYRQHAVAPSGAIASHHAIIYTGCEAPLPSDQEAPRLPDQSIPQRCHRAYRSLSQDDDHLFRSRLDAPPRPYQNVPQRYCRAHQSLSQGDDRHLRCPLEAIILLSADRFLRFLAMVMTLRIQCWLSYYCCKQTALHSRASADCGR